MNLDNVTLFAYTGLNDKEHILTTLKSLKHSAAQINFGSVKMIAPVSSLEDKDIELVEVDCADHVGYGRFFVEKLVDHIDTDYCLCVQWDSGILNPELWLDEFLEYDYIGSPWPKVDYYINRVGNGGFSLRSKKFLEISSEVTYDPYHHEYKCAPEDWFLCVKNYGYMIERGIKFPNVYTASCFSVEHPIPEKFFFRNNLDSYQSFGFHGDFNIAAMEKIK